MCRSTTAPAAALDRDRDCLKTRAFYVRLEINNSTAKRPLPEALTLVYIPPVHSTASVFNCSNVSTFPSTFVPLHGLRSAESNRLGKGIYASTERVRITDGSRFEVYVGAAQALKGVFRSGGEGEWKVELSACASEREVGAAAAQVAVMGERGERMWGTVRMARRKREGFCSKLEEIPEESDACNCSCCGEDDDDCRDDKAERWEMVRSDGKDEELEMEVEGVKWAVDLGIWVVCLGVGVLVSRAFRKDLKKKLFF